MPYSTQKLTILEHLRQFGSISSWLAIELYHITRLGAHIEVLRNDEGYPIKDEWKTDGKKHWKEYKLEEQIEVPLKEIVIGKQSQLSFV